MEKLGKIWISPEISRSESLVAKAFAVLTRNSSKVGFEYTPPSWPHYPHVWLWDGAFHAMVWGHLGNPEQAEKEIEAILKGQLDNGFVPNMRFHSKGRRLDPERYTFNKLHEQSDYTQPPVLALAALGVYESYREKDQAGQGHDFLAQVYPQLVKFYNYFNTLRKDDDGLIACIHPHETGRDSDPTFDRILKGVYPERTPRSVRTAISYFLTLRLNYKARKIGWRESEMKNLFWVKDVMFNCIYVDNLRCMAEIARELRATEDKNKFTDMANKVEAAILNKMWFKENQAFYAIATDQGKLPVLSVSNLFPLVLDNLPIDQLQSILNLLEDPKKFQTRFMIPSVAVDNPAYDPSYKEKRIWRGPVWINMNWYLVFRGLLKQISRSSEDPSASSPHIQELIKRMNSLVTKVTKDTLELVEKSGFREFYNSETGKGYRVKNFGWSTLVVFFKKLFNNLNLSMTG